MDEYAHLKQALTCQTRFLAVGTTGHFVLMKTVRLSWAYNRKNVGSQWRRVMNSLHKEIMETDKKWKLSYSINFHF